MNFRVSTQGVWQISGTPGKQLDISGFCNVFLCWQIWQLKSGWCPGKSGLIIFYSCIMFIDLVVPEYIYVPNKKITKHITTTMTFMFSLSPWASDFTPSGSKPVARLYKSGVVSLLYGTGTLKTNNCDFFHKSQNDFRLLQYFDMKEYFIIRF